MKSMASTATRTWQKVIANSNQRKKKSYSTRYMLKNNCLSLSSILKKVSYEDGAKVYFKNGGWIIARFSGTEPLLRIFAEMQDKDTAERVLQQFKDFLSL